MIQMKCGRWVFISPQVTHWPPTRILQIFIKAPKVLKLDQFYPLAKLGTQGVGIILQKSWAKISLLLGLGLVGMLLLGPPLLLLF